MAILLVTIALGLYDGRRYGSLYIFGYIIAIICALSWPRHNRPWQELGLKRGFVTDFKRVWYYFGIDALAVSGSAADVGNRVRVRVLP